ncbi:MULTISPECIES: maleylpyruvate isomerase family mycothiol-dependent enzyme [unclassified Streptomyces]|uniref:maleylpyruvate isomerase family mycothiol-dependent enzyme n=1 Tax=unclassified Streptomyces TaxID=2593676 RepID=UPI0003735046|nr:MULTISPECIES: maleylpyruvate isomerase family mycothiol-dependent enzyme [unclassified Streptomyces]MYT28785.1 maleylpyruvate isomerase family mycothiol-dependent enzyme [Streptomyces sp. SID8354]
MEITEFVETLRLDGGLLADAADEAGPDAPVPSCPEWRMRDLVHHIGQVHRWAAAYVTEPQEQRKPLPEDPVPGDDELVPWLREGHHRLVVALHTAPADLRTWTFLPAPSPLAFWARRQAHETSVHRADAQQAAGVPLTPLPARFAADGVDEILAGFHAGNRSRVRPDVPRSLRLRAIDTPDADWTVHLTPDAPPRTVRTSEAAGDAPDCTVEGPAEELYLALWNRLPWDGLKISGDPSLPKLWQERGAI